MRATLISLLMTSLSGVLYAFSFPSFLGKGWLPLLFISLPLFLWRLKECRTLKQLLLTVFVYNLTIDVVAYYWIPHTVREFGQLPFAVSHFVGFLFTLILQPHWWLFALWLRYRPKWKWDSEKGVLVTAFILTVFERYFPQQFPSFAGSPWLHLSPFLGLTPFFGVIIFSFMTYWMSLEVVKQLQLKKLRPQVWVAFTLFILFNALFPLQKQEEGGPTLAVRVVQANIGNFIKVTSERGDTNSFEAIIKEYKELSTKPGFAPDLIVWPETAYPNNFYGESTRLDWIFRQILKETGSELLIGGYDQDTSKSPFDMYETIFNSSLLISDNRVKSVYHKNILIPFGESLPFGPLNEYVLNFVSTVSLFARGEGTPLMETRDGHRFITPICYEILDSNFVRTLLNEWKDNHFMVNHTNDSWYGDTAEPHQHLFLSKWRALEFQLPIIRSTNTGITSVIFPDGSESKRLGVGEKAVLDVEVPISKGKNTVYQLYGVLPFFAFFLVLLGITSLREKN